MVFRRLHSWDIATTDAAQLQCQLASHVVVSGGPQRFEYVAGADVSYDRFSDEMFAGVVVLRLPDFALVERAAAFRHSTFPYIPGLLSFREAPAVLDAFARLRTEPDVVLIDGHGIAHPRRMGVASHIGLWLDRPTVGAAKTLLCGMHQTLQPAAGSTASLFHRGEIVGKVVRTRKRVAPIYVSPGHRISLERAVDVVLGVSRTYRIPEPTRLAHLYVNELRRAGRGHPDLQAAGQAAATAPGPAAPPSRSRRG